MGRKMTINMKGGMDGWMDEYRKVKMEGKEMKRNPFLGAWEREREGERERGTIGYVFYLD